MPAATSRAIDKNKPGVATLRGKNTDQRVSSQVQLNESAQLMPERTKSEERSQQKDFYGPLRQHR